MIPDPILPAGQGNPPQKRHQQGVLSAAYSPDYNFVVSTGKCPRAFGFVDHHRVAWGTGDEVVVCPLGLQVGAAV